MATDPWAEFEDVGAAPQGGPVYGPGPKAPAQRDPLAIRKDELSILKTERELAKPEEGDAPPSGYRWGPGGTLVPIPGGPADKTAAADPALAGKAGALDSVVNQIKRVQQLYDSGIRDENLWNAFGLLDSVGPNAAAFDSAGAALGDQGMAAFKVPGMGPQSDADAARFVAANQPEASDWDSRIEEKLRSLRQRVDANRAAMGLPPADWGTPSAPEQQDEPAAAMAAGGAPPPGPDGNPTPIPFSPGDPQYQAAQGTRTVEDPAMAAVAGQYRQMLAENRPTGEIIKLLRDAGAGPQTLMAAVAQAKYRRENPNVPIDRYSITSQVEVPTSTFEQVTTDLGSNAVGAYAIGAGQFLSGNTLDNMAGDPERARLAQGVAQAENPGAYGAGEFSGGMLAALTGEAGLARLGMASGLGRGLAADAGMGAANGAGMADSGNRFAGAAQGGLAATVGSLGGTAAMRGAGSVLSPSGGNLADLYASGVRPTPGQRFADSGGGRGLKGMAGRAINATEEALQSVPVVGSAIRGARQDARDQFQIGAFNQALSEIGEELPKGMKPGTDPQRFTQEAFNRVYTKARSAMTVVADEQMANDLAALVPDISTLGDQAVGRFKAIMRNAVTNKFRDGQMTGGGYKAAVSDLGKHIARHRSGLMAEDQALADVLEGVQGALDNAARRHSDPEAVELLDAADAGYAKFVRIEEAAKRRGGDAGTFSPANFDSAVQRASGGVRSKAYLRGDALMQDYAAAGRSLDDKLPNSGTADRVMAGYAVGSPVAGGAIWMEPTFAALFGTIAGAYAPGVRKATTGAMAPAGPTRKAISQQLKKRARLAGRAGAAGAVVSSQGTAPGQ